MRDTMNRLRMLISRLLLLMLVLLMQLFNVLACRVPPLGALRGPGGRHVQAIIVCSRIGGGDSSAGWVLKTAGHFVCE